jgi:hypothetical protein
MGIALLAFSGLFQGLSNLTRPAPIAVKSSPANMRSRPVWVSRRPACAPQGMPIVALTLRAHATKSAPALRVLRVTESDQRVKGAGRMVISGRMADVCAELDRMAAAEAAQARI